MMKFNLNDYETVDERLRRFHKDNPQARVMTDLIEAVGEPGRTRWTVKAFVFRDREAEQPDATGLAFEIDGTGMANQTSALENCETSAIGRALANLGYSGNRRPTREEMRKTQPRKEMRKTQQQPRESAEDIIKAAKLAGSEEELEAIKNHAKDLGAPPRFIEMLKRG